MLGTGLNLIRSAYSSALGYIRDGLKLYMPFRGGHSDEVKFVGTGSASFDGGDYVNMGDVCDLGTADFTIALWVKSVEMNNDYWISKWQQDEDRWYLKSDSDETLFFYSVAGDSAQITFKGVDGGMTAHQGKWVHIAIVADRSASIGAYVNGVLDGSPQTSAGDATDIDNSGPLYIGRYGTDYFNGSMKNVAIWNRALTATEVQNVMYKTYDEVGGRLASGLQSWWVLEEKATATTTADSKGSNTGTLGDGSTSTTYPTFATTPDIYGGDTPIKPRAIDNAPTVQADAIGAGSAFFDQDNADYITMGDVAAFSDADGFSIAFWVKFVEITGDSALVTKHANYGAPYAGGEYYIINDDGICEFVLVDDGQVATIGTKTGTVFVAGNWYHVACTHDGGTASSGCLIYIDGVLQAHNANGNTDSGGTFANVDNTIREFRIGAFADNHPGTECHDGNICQVGFWSAVLTQAQIQSIMEKTYDELTSTEKEDLVSYWPLDEAVQVLNFDGSSQINLASTIELAEDTAWSISFWQHQGGDDDSYIIGMNSESPARYKIRHRSDLIRVYFPSGSSNDLNATDVLTEWTHIVITCDGTDSSNLKYYLEGSLEDTESATNTAFNIDTIGGAGGTGFDGKLAQVAVYDKALSAGEVTAQLNLGASGDWSSDSNLLGYWKMDNATTVTDLSGKGNHGTVDGATLVDGYLDDSTGNGNFGDMQ